MKNFILIFLFTLFSCQCLLGQSFWKDISIDKNIVSKNQALANSYRGVIVDVDLLKNELASVPKRSEKTQTDVEKFIKIPTPDGNVLEFIIFQTQTMEAELAAKFPEIKSYYGYNPDHPEINIRFDVSPNGFNALITGKDSPIYIDALRGENFKKKSHAICYYKKDFIKTAEHDFHCHFTNDDASDKLGNAIADYKIATDNQLQTYRLAAACNGEFTNYHGGTVAGAISAANTTINRVNQVYERDLGIRLVLIANNDQIVYTNPSSDPYSNNDPFEMIAQNQSNLNSVIGTANYDIGHVFSTGGGGLAARGVCINSVKAQGVTGLTNPIGDPFYIDYVAHEIGHQFGANHTFNNSCNDNRVDAAAVEPGSGSTIMAYAGICSPNIQTNSDAYFHAISIQEVINFTQNGSGSSCASFSSDGNNVPTVFGGNDKYIPIGTPFELTATASDSDGDQLTYCWEQMDNGIAPMPPSSNNAVGPLFRSILPTTNATRTFPDKISLLNNSNDTWEKLPNVTRDLNFTITVRDNNLGNGGVADDDILLKSTSAAGPFLVTNPNTTITWIVGNQETIVWNVANTEKQPILCGLVDILLSTDGGNNFDQVIASSVINSGTYTFTVPNIIGTQNRIKIKCSDNVFFDISNQNFIIQESQLPFNVNTPNATIFGCTNQQLSIPINTQNLMGGTNTISFTANGIPPTAVGVFSPNAVQPGTSSFLNITGLENGAYSISINATDGTFSQTINIDLKIGLPESSFTIYPPQNDNLVNLLPILNWTYSDLAQFYSIEISTDPQFSNIIESASNIMDNKYELTTILEEQTTYYWTVTAHNNCGRSSNNVYIFTTKNVQYCIPNSNSYYEWIQSVSFADLNNNSGDNDGYGDFTNLTANVTAGSNYAIALNPAFRSQIYVEYWKVWIDFNKNGSFEDNGELVFESIPPVSTLLNGTVTIPDDVLPTTTRMRVSMHYETPQEPCQNLDFGEIEDYSITITSNCGSGTADSDLDGVCDGLDICPGGNDNIDIDNNGVPDDCQEVNVALKVWLEGANSSTQAEMNSYLNDLNLLPSSHPYTNPATYNYTLPASLSSFPANMVDWIYVEARTGANNTDFYDHKVGLLMKDGSIKDLDGTSNLKFALPPGGNYYFLVRHRNHLDVLTATGIPRSLNMSYDFTTARSNAYGGVQKLSANGKAMMFAGDIDGNMQIQITDFDAWKTSPAANQIYRQADIDLDGQIQITDYDTWYYNRSVNAPSELSH